MATKPSWAKVAGIVAAGLGAEILLAGADMAVMWAFGINPPGRDMSVIMGPLENGRYVAFGLLLLATVVAEEVIFRVLPIMAGYAVGGLRGAVAAIVVASALFGYAHGGFAYIPIQGVGGLLYSALYLWAGGLAFVVRPLSAVLLTHFSFDLVLFAAIQAVRSWS